MNPNEEDTKQICQPGVVDNLSDRRGTKIPGISRTKISWN